ncbi:hypothetical protein HDU85_004647 [Gaertneriomyces sp. JEL0708]|nr:hypothetical protein HDU85_004647 [Gaertneriomyces sp. JEL0708]
MAKSKTTRARVGTKSKTAIAALAKAKTMPLLTDAREHVVKAVNDECENAEQDINEALSFVFDYWQRIMTGEGLSNPHEMLKTPGRLKSQTLHLMDNDDSPAMDSALPRKLFQPYTTTDARAPATVQRKRKSSIEPAQENPSQSSIRDSIGTVFRPGPLAKEGEKLKRAKREPAVVLRPRATSASCQEDETEEEREQDIEKFRELPGRDAKKAVRYAQGDDVAPSSPDIVSDKTPHELPLSSNLSTCPPEQDVTHAEVGCLENDIVRKVLSTPSMVSGQVDVSAPTPRSGLQPKHSEVEAPPTVIKAKPLSQRVQPEVRSRLITRDSSLASRGPMRIPTLTKRLAASRVVESDEDSEEDFNPRTSFESFADRSTDTIETSRLSVAEIAAPTPRAAPRPNTRESQDEAAIVPQLNCDPVPAQQGNASVVKPRAIPKVAQSTHSEVHVAHGQKAWQYQLSSMKEVLAKQKKTKSTSSNGSSGVPSEEGRKSSGLSGKNIIIEVPLRSAGMAAVRPRSSLDDASKGAAPKHSILDAPSTSLEDALTNSENSPLRIEESMEEVASGPSTDIATVAAERTSRRSQSSLGTNDSGSSIYADAVSCIPGSPDMKDLKAQQQRDIVDWFRDSDEESHQSEHEELADISVVQMVEHESDDDEPVVNAGINNPAIETDDFADVAEAAEARMVEDSRDMDLDDPKDKLIVPSDVLRTRSSNSSVESAGSASSSGSGLSKPMRVPKATIAVKSGLPAATRVMTSTLSNKSGSSLMSQSKVQPARETEMRKAQREAEERKRKEQADVERRQKLREAKEQRLKLTREKQQAELRRREEEAKAREEEVQRKKFTVSKPSAMKPAQSSRVIAQPSKALAGKQHPPSGFSKPTEASKPSKLVKPNLKLASAITTSTSIVSHTSKAISLSSSQADIRSPVLGALFGESSSSSSKRKRPIKHHKHVTSIVDENGNLPEPPSDYSDSEDEYSDDGYGATAETPVAKKAKTLEPDWVHTPELMKLIHIHQRTDPDDVFGGPQAGPPLEDVFREGMRKKPIVPRRSSMWGPRDKISQREIEEYKVQMGYK